MSDNEEERLKGHRLEGYIEDEWKDSYLSILRESVKEMMKEGGFEIVVGCPPSKQTPELEKFLKGVKQKIIDDFNEQEKESKESE